MTLSMFQILILSLYTGIAQTDGSAFDMSLQTPLFSGFFTGLIIGNVPLGIAVGGTLQLMSLGLATYGGTAVPDYMTGSIVGTVFANIALVSAGGNTPLEESMVIALAVAIPVGLLLIQFDILRRTFNVVWQHMAVKAAEKRQYGRVNLALYLGMITAALSRIVPCFVALMAGDVVVNNVIENMPTWLMNGLRVAGGILPAMGMAILLRYLPLKKYYVFCILGFVLFAYRNVSYNMVAVALLAFVFASVFMMLKNEMSRAITAKANNDDMEVEVDE